MRKKSSCGENLKSPRLICKNNILDKSGRPSWYVDLAQNEKAWNFKIMEEAPTIIAYEYKTLYDHVCQGTGEALPIKIRDIIEAELKFLSLIKLSQAFHNGQSKIMYKEILYDLLKKEPSMGDWVSIASKLGKMDRGDSISYALIKLTEMCNKHNIVKWRNNTIGHGALSPTDRAEFQDDMIEKIFLLSEYYGKVEEFYTSSRLIARGNNKKYDIQLKGYDGISTLDGKRDKLFFQTGQSNLQLLPLIRVMENGIYFFDAFIAKKNIVSYFDYVTTDRKEKTEKIINEMYLSLHTLLNIKATESAADTSLIISDREKNVENIIRPSSFIELHYLQEKLQSLLETHKSGIYMIQMEDGMGKTTFVRMHDRLSYNYKKSGARMVRAVYINSVYGFKPQYFITEIVDALRTTETKEKLTGEIPSLDINEDNVKEKFASFISSIFRFNNENLDINQLIIFIDGIDEIPYTEDATILDLLPNSELLPEGVHIVLTGRTPDQTSEFIKRKLQEISLVNEYIVIDHNDSDYQEDLYNGIIKIIGEQPEIARKIQTLAGNKIMNLGYLIRAYEQRGTDGLNQIDQEDGYWHFLESIYGEQYFQEILKTAYILACTPLPITIRDLAYLKGDMHVTFKLQAFVGELKQFIHSERMPNDTALAITRPETRKFILNQNHIRQILSDEWDISLKRYENDNELTKDDYHHLGLLISLIAKNNKKGLDNKIFDCVFKKYVKMFLLTVTKSSMWEYEINDIIARTLVNRAMNGKLDFDHNNLVLFLSHMLTYYKEYGMVSEGIQISESFMRYLRAKSVRVSVVAMGKVFFKLGELHAYINEQEEADKFYRLAKQMSEEAVNITPTKFKPVTELMTKIEVLISEAIAFKNRNNIARAMDSLKDAERILNRVGDREKMPKEVQHYYANIYAIYGNLYKRIKPQKAVEYLEKAIEIVDRYNFEDTEGRIDMLLNLGQAYRQLRRFQDADSMYVRAIEAKNKAIEIKGGDVNPIQLISLYNSRGNVQRDQHHNEEAIPLFSKAIELYEKAIANGAQLSKEIYLSMLASRKSVYERLGKMKEARNDEEKMDTIFQSSNSLNYGTIAHVSQGYKGD